MLEENKKSILNDNYLFNKRKDATTKARFLKVKHRTFLIGIAVAFFCILGFYLKSDESRIFKLIVKNNIYLDEKEIIEVSGLKDDYFLFFSKNKAKRNLLKHPLIKNISIKRQGYRFVEIEVEEEKVVAYFNEGEKTYLVLLNGDFIEWEEPFLTIPYIEGFTNEQLKALVSGFADLKYDYIDEISEIHRYPFSYDENMMELIMRDGNYVFVSSFGLKMLNQYHAIISGLNNPVHSCIYLDEVTNSGYLSACPWHKEELKEE